MEAAAPQARHPELFLHPWETTNYVCNWSKRYRYVYVETPKAACTTIKRVLQQAEVGGGITYRHENDVHRRDRSPLLQPQSDVEEFTRAIEGSRYFRFCFVRNPYTRALSCYLDKMVQNEHGRVHLAPQLGLDPSRVPPFADFLSAIAERKPGERDLHFELQSWILQPERVSYSFIGRFEHFQEQFPRVCTKLGIPPCADLPPATHATNASSHLKQYLGRREAELIRQIYADDFKAFAYGWSADVL